MVFAETKKPDLGGVFFCEADGTHSGRSHHLWHLDDWSAHAACCDLRPRNHCCRGVGPCHIRKCPLSSILQLGETPFRGTSERRNKVQTQRRDWCLCSV